MTPILELGSGPHHVGLLRTEDGSVPRQATSVTVSLEPGRRLAFDFLCSDDHAWGRMDRRDDPIWDEEVVEVFLSPGEDVPRRYWEVEVSPIGTVWDGWIDSPNLGRIGMVQHPEWDCPGLENEAWIDPARGGWGARIVIPLDGIDPAAKVWRLNLYRIDRPKESPPEFTAWSPTIGVPADFHRPERFGLLRLPG